MLAGDWADSRIERDSLGHDMADGAISHGWWAPGDCVE